MKHKLLVFGGREGCGQEFVAHYLTELAGDLQHPIGLVIQGDAQGVDHFAKVWAMSNGIPTCSYEANWRFHGRAAGPIRNGIMLEFGQPTLALGFPGGRGTANMCKRLHELDLPRILINRSEDGPIVTMLGTAPNLFGYPEPESWPRVAARS